MFWVQYFVEANAIAVRRVPKEDMRHIAKATGATQVKSFNLPAFIIVLFSLHWECSLELSALACYVFSTEVDQCVSLSNVTCLLFLLEKSFQFGIFFKLLLLSWSQFWDFLSGSFYQTMCKLGAELFFIGVFHMCCVLYFKFWEVTSGLVVCWWWIFIYGCCKRPGRTFVWRV